MRDLFESFDVITERLKLVEFNISVYTEHFFKSIYVKKWVLLFKHFSITYQSKGEGGKNLQICTICK